MSDNRLRDPVAYRIDYSLAAQDLHAVTVIREREVPGRVREREMEPPQGLYATVEKVRQQLIGSEWESEPSLERARQLTLNLIQASAIELSRQGWRWPGRRPPWYVRRRRGANDRRLAEFLDCVLEPAAVVLFWSCEAEQGEPPWWEEAPAVAPDRRDLDGRGEAIDVRWLAAYIAELLEPRSPRLSIWDQFRAWIGFARLRSRANPDPRVRYNLACLFSRLAGRRYVVANEEPGERLRKSAEQLWLAIDGMSGRQREELVKWSADDPGLQNLRSMDGFGPRDFGL